MVGAGAVAADDAAAGATTAAATTVRAGAAAASAARAGVAAAVVVRTGAAAAVTVERTMAVVPVRRNAMGQGTLVRVSRGRRGTMEARGGGGYKQAQIRGPGNVGEKNNF